MNLNKVEAANELSLVTISDRYRIDIYGRWFGLYECFCGRIFSADNYKIKKKHTKSCGCYKLKYPARKTHGKRKTPEYNIWAGMVQRCTNDNNEAYSYYKGRGITVSEEWLSSFENFYRDMGPRPGPDYSIDRIDNNKGYCKDNCRWATRKEQNNNQRKNKKVTFNGKTQSLHEWASELNMNYDTLHGRLFDHRWPIEKAFTKPVRKR